MLSSRDLFAACWRAGFPAAAVTCLGTLAPNAGHVADGGTDHGAAEVRCSTRSQ